MSRRNGEHGMIFALSLLAVFVLTTVGGAMIIRSGGELSISERSVRRERAFHVAEAGLDDALNTLGTSSMQWNDELLGTDGLAGTFDDGILSFGPSVDVPPNSSSAVRVFDNTDEPTGPDDPTADVDGILGIQSTGTVTDSSRTVTAWVWSLFNYSISAQQDILLRQASAMGNMHANRNIEVRQTSVLLGCTQATASGSFIIPAGETLVHACGDLVGGDPPIVFLTPNVAALRAAVTQWNPPNSSGTIFLFDRDVAGYDIQLGIVPHAPQTVSLIGSATIAMFDGNSIRFRQRIGSFDKSGNCIAPVNLNVIAVDGSITFEQPTCLRGLVWASGSVMIAQGSKITGAVVSAGGSVDVRQSTLITFDRSVIDGSLLSGFWGVTMLSWQEGQ